MSEWISVEDRLPEKQSWNHIAILDTKTGRISVEQDLYAIEMAEKFKQKKGFCKDGRFNGREVVIAWMPFPKPPISKQVTSSKRRPATETCLFCGQVIPKWIKCEDKLPPDQDEVLVCTVSQKGIRNIDKGYWSIDHFIHRGCARVTHWMPLPEAPKEET
jgi:hypothetical protein